MQLYRHFRQQDQRLRSGPLLHPRESTQSKFSTARISRAPVGRSSNFEDIGGAYASAAGSFCLFNAVAPRGQSYHDLLTLHWSSSVNDLRGYLALSIAGYRSFFSHFDSTFKHRLPFTIGFALHQPHGTVVVAVTRADHIPSPIAPIFRPLAEGEGSHECSRRSMLTDVLVLCAGISTNYGFVAAPAP